MSEAEGRQDIAEALAGLLDDEDSAPGGAPEAPGPEASALTGRVLTAEDQAERAALVPHHDADDVDDRDDSEVATSVDDPAGKYTTKRAAKREFERLVRNTGKLSRDIALWVHRAGPALMGFKSAAEGVMAIKDVAKSQAYRDVYLAEVAEQLALAAGLFDDPDGVKRVLDLPGLTAKNAELIRPQLTMLTEEVQRQANRESAASDTVLDEIVPRVVKDFVQRKKNPPVTEEGTAPAGQEQESAAEEVTGHPQQDEAGGEPVNPYLAYASESAAADDSADGDLPPEVSIPAQAGEDDGYEPCPHCAGTGRVARTAAGYPLA